MVIRIQPSDVTTKNKDQKTISQNSELNVDIRCKSSTSSTKVTKDDSVKLINLLTELGEDLRKQHFDKDRKEVIIKRIQLGNFLVREIFEEENINDENKEKLKYIAELLEKQCRLVTEIMKALKRTTELRSKLDTLKKDNFEKRTESRRIMLEIKEKNEAKQQIIRDPETMQSLKEFDIIMQKDCDSQTYLAGSCVR
ncbi:unnamed protein product [Mytilus edulis]|uniref:Uncharacterized protein n=1 Tax=Mytilus edulis TaxID=6550 RepID=A0A8S3VF74_MYTED|nr:unnamed protein product [Mytilus edulis]